MKGLKGNNAMFVEKDEYGGVWRAFETLHSMWNEERSHRREKETKELQIANEEIIKAKFLSLVAKTKRFQKGEKIGELSFRDLSRLAKKAFPDGINGRQVDEKWARTLYDRWK